MSRFISFLAQGLVILFAFDYLANMLIGEGMQITQTYAHGVGDRACTGVSLRFLEISCPYEPKRKPAQVQILFPFFSQLILLGLILLYVNDIMNNMQNIEIIYKA